MIQILKKMPSTTIAQSISNDIIKKKQKDSHQSSKILECEKLSQEFWICVKKHNTITECGPSYYYLSKCIEKLA